MVDELELVDTLAEMDKFEVVYKSALVDNFVKLELVDTLAEMEMLEVVDMLDVDDMLDVVGMLE